MGSRHLFSCPVGKIALSPLCLCNCICAKTHTLYGSTGQHDQGLQKAPVCSLAHVSTEGHSSLPLSRASLSQSCALPAPASPAQAGAGQSMLCSCPHCHRSLPWPSEPTYFTQVQEGCFECQGRGPARSHHQNPSRSFVHPSPGFWHVLTLQITSQIPEQLQTLPAPFKREQ